MMMMMITAAIIKYIWPFCTELANDKSELLVENIGALPMGKFYVTFVGKPELLGPYFFVFKIC